MTVGELISQSLTSLVSSNIQIPTSISSFIAGFTFIFTFFTFYCLAYDRLCTKPKIKVLFDKRHNNVKYNCNEKRTINLYLINKGDSLKIKKPSAHQISASFYFPDTFDIHEIRRAGKKGKKVYSSSSYGKFRGMKYVEVPSVHFFNPPAISVLCFNEVEKIEIDITTPPKAGTYKIYIPINTRQGDQGVKKLKICISDK